MKRLIVLVMVVLSTAAWAEDGFGVDGARIVGADVRWNASPFDVLIGGGYEFFDLGRDLTTGAPRPVADPTVTLQIPHARVVARAHWLTDEVDFWAGVGVWGSGALAWASAADAFPDQNGGLLALATVGATRNRVTTNAHGVPSGPWAEALLEASPRWASATATKYTRAEVRTSWFVSLWDADTEQQTFSGVLGLRANALWRSGDAVPLLLIEPTEVRGYHGAYDTRLRSVASAEVRVGLPSLWGVADVVPMVFGFGEAGWYSGYDNAPAAYRDRTGWLASVGGGFALALFGVAAPQITIAQPLTGESSWWWGINFGYRF